MKTNTGREIKVTPNYSNRTFTIKCKDEITVKYRTIKFCKEDFEIEEMNTANDWQHFLDNTDEYYIVK